jgi:hypothetical protein
MKPSLVNHDDFISPVPIKPTENASIKTPIPMAPRSLFNPTIFGIIMIIIFLFVLYDRYLYKKERHDEYNKNIHDIVSKINIEADSK